jgi:hypothetical protein
MVIALKYEIVPHFCFSSGRIGHAAINCDNSLEAHRVAYGEELRASPPRQTKEIMVKSRVSRVVRPLFQVIDMLARGQYEAGRISGRCTTSMRGDQARRAMPKEDVSKQDGTREQLANIVKELHDACNSAEASWAAQGSSGKERVSLGTNMSTEESPWMDDWWNRSWLAR